MKAARVIPVVAEGAPARADNGFDFCEDCGFFESVVCDQCEEGERFIDAEDLKAVAA